MSKPYVVELTYWSYYFLALEYAEFEIQQKK